MNKLIIDNVFDLSDIVITEDTTLIERLEDACDTIHIHVDDNVCLYEVAILKNTKNKIIYHLGNNSQAIINRIAVDNSDQLEVYLDGELASITCNSSIINYNENIYREKIYHHQDNTTSSVTNHAINVGSNDFTFEVDAVIPKESDNSYCHQDNKIINMGSGKNTIKPNLLVDNNQIEASHSAYIGEFNKDSIFYLMTRGISLEVIKDMLSVGFLLDKMELKEAKDEVVNFIKNNI